MISSQEFEEKFNYIHHNPVKRELARRAIDWHWSSARWYAGFDDGHPVSITPLLI